MSEEVKIFDILRVVLLWLSPVIMIVGSALLLLSSGAYSDLENKLGKEIGGFRKKVVPILETNVNSLHNWMLAHKNIVGLVFIICALLFFLRK